MQLKVLLFGIAREIAGSSTLEMETAPGARAEDIKHQLVRRYPALNGLKSFMIAVNNEYARPETQLQEGDEIAVIPPVSGG